MGIPETFSSQAAYFERLQFLRKLGTLGEQQGFWDDLRLHHRYGTLEVRICDATPSLRHVWLISSLLQCEVIRLLSAAKKPTPNVALPRFILEENKWRVRRWGLAATLIDSESGAVITLLDYYQRWLQDLTPIAIELGILERLRHEMQFLFEQGTAADRSLAVWRDSHSMPEVISNLIQSTDKN